MASPALVSWVLCTLCAAQAPLAQVLFASLDSGLPSCFLHNLYPSQFGGVPRSGIYGHSRARKNDQRDPGEKRFPSLVLFIILLPLPLVAPPYSTVAPLCIPGHCAFSCAPQLCCGKRGERVDGESIYTGHAGGECE